MKKEKHYSSIKNIKAIVDALQKVPFEDEVFLVLSYAHSSNLENMQDMIKFILNEREEDKNHAN